VLLALICRKRHSRYSSLFTLTLNERLRTQLSIASLSALTYLVTHYCITETTVNSLHFASYRVSRRRREMYCGHARLCVCLSAAACPHYCTDPDVTLGSGRGCPLVVHGLRSYGNITRTRNVIKYMLVLALCPISCTDLSPIPVRSAAKFLVHPKLKQADSMYINSRVRQAFESTDQPSTGES